MNSDRAQIPVPSLVRSLGRCPKLRLRVISGQRAVTRLDLNNRTELHFFELALDRRRSVLVLGRGLFIFTPASRRAE